MKTRSKYFLAALASVGVMAGATLMVLVGDLKLSGASLPLCPPAKYSSLSGAQTASIIG